MLAQRMHMPIVEGLDATDDLPHTITQAILYRMKIDSLNELPDNKKPPRDLWNKPHKLREFLDDVFDIQRAHSKEYIDLNLEEVE